MDGPALTLQEAAKRLEEVADRARRLGESTVLTSNGEPVARIVPIEPAKTLGGLLEWWRTHERLDPEEVDAWAADIEEFRRLYNKPPDPSRWE